MSAEALLVGCIIVGTLCFGGLAFFAGVYAHHVFKQRKQSKGRFDG